MVDMGKECGFPSNFDMPWPFTPGKTGLPCITELQPIKSPKGLLYPRVDLEQRIHSRDEIDHCSLTYVQTQQNFYFISQQGEIPFLFIVFLIQRVNVSQSAGFILPNCQAANVEKVERERDDSL